MMVMSSKKVKKRVGRVLVSMLGLLVAIIGIVAFVFVLCSAFNVRFPSVVDNLDVVKKVKSNTLLSLMSTGAFTLLGVVILLSVRLIVNDEKHSIKEEYIILDARYQAKRDVGDSIDRIFGEDEINYKYDGDFMPPSCLYSDEEVSINIEEDVAEEKAVPNIQEVESDKTVVSIKPLLKTRKHKRRIIKR